MHPDTQRRLEAKLDEDGYGCDTFCKELPYTIWNTCPICLCGLLPVLVVCFSAICQLDYATHVTDIGAQIVNQMGLSYTVYYTAGCWPHEPKPADWVKPISQFSDASVCDEANFEIAAGEFDALSGSLLRVRNVTAIHAKKLVAVKVTPDWRFITFLGSLNTDVGNFYAVNAQEKDAKQAIPLLGKAEIDALEAQCEMHSPEAIRLQKESSSPDGTSDDPARLAGFRQLQVIIPGIAPVEYGGDLSNIPQPPPGSSLVYRAAFSFDCKQLAGGQPIGRGGPEMKLVHFSKIAVVDFQMLATNSTDPDEKRPFAYAQSSLRLIDTTPLPPRGANDYAIKASKRFRSQSCPRFVPSKQGMELLFVAEDVVPAKKTPFNSAWHSPTVLPDRVLAVLQVPTANAEERRLAAEFHNSPNQMEVAQEAEEAEVADVRAKEMKEALLEQEAEEGTEAKQKVAEARRREEARTAVEEARKAEEARHRAAAATAAKASRAAAAKRVQDAARAALMMRQESTILAGAEELRASSLMLDIGERALPFAPVSGCPEFVPSLLHSTPSLAQTFKDSFLKSPDEQAEEEVERSKLRDSFVVLSDPSSNSVLGVDAQVLAGSLPLGAPTGEVLGVSLLYNVNSAMGTGGHERLRIGGCQPIRAAGRTGHMRMQFALETVMNTFQVDNEKKEYSAWLACLTADQRVAIVESPKREHWINMSMPFPTWTGKQTQGVWCPDDQQESCFEVWSNPNPNE